jgi:hypothetical protein
MEFDDLFMLLSKLEIAITAMGAPILINTPIKLVNDAPMYHHKLLAHPLNSNSN